MVPLFIGWHWFEPVAKKNMQGIKAYQEKKFDQALSQFLSAKGIKPDSAELKHNTASALYQLKKYKEALEEFSKIDLKKSGISESDFFYNLGNTYFRSNQFNEALESYKKSLIANASDINAKKNYELTLKKIEEKQDKKKQDENKDKKKDKQKKEDNQEMKMNQNQKYKNLMQYLNQKEKEQLKKKKRKMGIAKKEKDW